MRVHLVGVARPAMTRLAVLLREAGHDVSASDLALASAARSALESAGIRLLPSIRANDGDGLELVVMRDDRTRADDPEATRARELGLATATLPRALRDLFVAGKRALVVAGAGDRGTTAAMCTWILETDGLSPGFFLSTRAENLGASVRPASTRRKLIGSSAKPAPFVVESEDEPADEPWAPTLVGPSGEDVLVLTSGGPDAGATGTASTERMAELVARVPEGGLIVADAADTIARDVVMKHARSRLAFYALDSDGTGDVTPTWLAATAGTDPSSGARPFDLYAGGSFCGRFAIELPGAHDARSAVAAVAAAAEGFGVHIEKARRALATFEARRGPSAGRDEGGGRA